MAKKSYHVIPAPEGGWSVKKAGATRASKHFDSKAAAISWGRNVSQNQGTEFFIHKKDGTIEDTKDTIQIKESYGCDPNPAQDRDTHK
ncbi:MAG: DUF2188 domain-containing protein [Desulfobacca sp.]|nr:DUF2188 domain-containing protein [Desulfobacca sp.]